jgi:hypothetical protein
MSEFAGQLNPEIFRFSGGSSAYANPMYRYIHTFIPSNLQELFAWCEFIYNNSPQLATSIRRFSEYPITDIVFPEDSIHVEKYKKYFHDIDLKDFLMCCGIDFHIYGNCFVSPYYPFIRYLICDSCHQKYNVDMVDFKMQDYRWLLKCPTCNKERRATVVDKRIKNPKGLRWVRWSPSDMDIEYNEISGLSKYHLRIPKNVITGIQQSRAHILKTTPLEIIEAVKQNKRFTFHPNAIYHMKAHTPSGFSRAWGFPMLTQALYEVLHIAVLKRANEAVAWEHIVPKIVLSPAPSGTAGDPLKHIALSKWKGEIETAKSKWNKDPNYIMFTPFPINVQQLGGNGRSLLVSAEIEAAEKNLAMALGIPLEFAAGTLAWQTSAMSLRLLKNQMHVLVGKIERLIQWMVSRTGEFLQWPTFEVSMSPFELADDETRKQYMMQYNQQEKVSDQTMLTSLGLDFEEEMEKVKQEKLDKARVARELEIETQKDAMSIQERAQRAEAFTQMRAQSQVSMPLGTDPVQSSKNDQLSQAQQMAELLLSSPPQEKSMQLQALQQQDFALYAITKAIMDSTQQAQSGEQQAQVLGNIQSSSSQG